MRYILIALSLIACENRGETIVIPACDTTSAPRDTVRCVRTGE